MDDDLPNPILRSALAALAIPPLGRPLRFGLLFGGPPSAVLIYLTILRSGELYLELLIAVATLVAATVAVTSANDRLGQLLWNVFLTNLGTCLPVPLVTWVAVAYWTNGLDFDILALPNLPGFSMILALVTLSATVLGWLLAISLAFLKHRCSHDTSTTS